MTMSNGTIALKSLFRFSLMVAVCALTFSSIAKADDHMIVKESSKSVAETIDALQTALEAKGISIMGRVDHQANAKNAGLDMPPTMLLIFGNPKMGTPLMLANRKIGIDLPMKALAWEDGGKVYLAYTDPKELKDRYDIDDKDELFAKMGKALGAFTDKATQ